VGPYESDPENGFLSIATPIGKALLGLMEGDGFLVESPSGEDEFRIIHIQ
jgi:transcription elongation factor GreA